MGFPTKVQLIKRRASEKWSSTFSFRPRPSHGVLPRRNRQWFVEQGPARLATRLSARLRAKKNSTGILSHFEQLWRQCGPASTSVASPRMPKPSR